MAGIRVFSSKKFKTWFKTLTEKEKRIVDARVGLAKNIGILNNYKELDKEYFLYEFKWGSGMRVYFSLLKDKEGDFILLLTGGNKNSQNADITVSKNLIRKAVEGLKK